MTEASWTPHTDVAAEICRVTEALSIQLAYLAGLGFTGWNCKQEVLDILDLWSQGPHPGRETLETVEQDLGACRRCKLHTGRRRIVFGEGNPRAELVFVGEGPGFEEDQSGRPFVGPAGQLLTRIIDAIGRERNSVYICNIVKCRPPGNRLPEPDEVTACLPFLKRQLRAIRPRFICTLGSLASQTLLGTEDRISRLRGRFHTFEGIRVLPTYHPSYLLRNPQKKREVWEDMKRLMHAF